MITSLLSGMHMCARTGVRGQILVWKLALHVPHEGQELVGSYRAVALPVGPWADGRDVPDAIQAALPDTFLSIYRRVGRAEFGSAASKL